MGTNEGAPGGGPDLSSRGTDMKHSIFSFLTILLFVSQTFAAVGFDLVRPRSLTRPDQDLVHSVSEGLPEQMVKVFREEAGKLPVQELTPFNGANSTCHDFIVFSVPDGEQLRLAQHVLNQIRPQNGYPLEFMDGKGIEAKRNEVNSNPVWVIYQVPGFRLLPTQEQNGLLQVLKQEVGGLEVHHCRHPKDTNRIRTGNKP